MKQYGRILWIDTRHGTFEGQILSESGQKYYFNESVWNHGTGPCRNESVKFYTDSIGITQVSDLCGSLDEVLDA